MIGKYFYFLCISISFLIVAQLFIYSTDLKTDNQLHQREFNMKYGIFSIVKPKGLNFCNEVVPIYSSDIWERLDKQLLKNTYWQSNTMLYFKKANKYFPVIEPILREYNIPDDFKYLAVIESGLENVVSPSGAAGFWQIMKGTAREYGLEVNKSIDERYNLEKATVVACKYLNEAYDKFGSWTIAAASYNIGMNGMRRKIQAQTTNNFYNLYLNSETSQYIFRIVAIKEIMENPKKYGFIFRDHDLYVMSDYKHVEIDSTIADLFDFARLNNINYKLLKQSNPWLRTTSLPDESRKKYVIKIPVDTNLMLFDNIELGLDSLN
uniref:Soluble lytic murein transglycosylase and related regulatory proteins (Some contain lysm/invasin domains) n=1 Tax=uncultured Sphingobacteriales bacterium HF0130_33B19 TaxID=710991 RepID=E0XTQ5_9SPHI|nr:soluble lytic murein transglycosylase and related regulatory proteins (some contain lysm/invasin domains) [uncultured Sphingobacteriales bacterium HF0130_33B19]